MNKIDYYCKGCAGEITIFGSLSKNSSVYCKSCMIEMYEVDEILTKSLKKQHRALKYKLKRVRS